MNKEELIAYMEDQIKYWRRRLRSTDYESYDRGEIRGQLRAFEHMIHVLKRPNIQNTEKEPS